MFTFYRQIAGDSLVIKLHEQIKPQNRIGNHCAVRSGKFPHILRTVREDPRSSRG